MAASLRLVKTLNGGKHPIGNTFYEGTGPSFNGKVTLGCEDIPINHIHLLMDVVKVLKRAIDGQELFIDSKVITITIDVK
jgi:hypothetical protein